MSPHTLTFVTGNADKLADVRGYLGPSISLDSVALHLPELQGTVDDIARDKCRRAADIVRSAPLPTTDQVWDD
jgi:inosine triphosphate pyrophosphatase